MVILAGIIHWTARLIILLLVVYAILSYVMSPFDPIRQRVDRVVNPLLAPIRRVVPPVGMMDFSPLILIILIQLLDSLLTWIILSL